MRKLRQSRPKNLTKEQILQRINRLSFLTMTGKDNISDQAEKARFQKALNDVKSIAGEYPKDVDSALSTLRVLIKDVVFNYEACLKDLKTMRKHVLWLSKKKNRDDLE